MVNLNAVPLDILHSICQWLGLHEICFLFASNDRLLCRSLVSPQVVDHIHIVRYERSFIVVNYLKNIHSLPKFIYQGLNVEIPLPLFLSVARPPLRSLTLHGTIDTASHHTYLSQCRNETFASLFPGLKMLIFLPPSARASKSLSKDNRNALLQHLCSKLPSQLETLKLRAVHVWPALQALPSSLTHLSVLEPVVMADYAQESILKLTESPFIADDVRLNPLWSTLRILDRNLPCLSALSIRPPLDSTYSNVDPMPGSNAESILPHLQTLTLEITGGEPNVLPLLHILGSITDLKIRHVNASGGGLGLTRLPPNLTSLQLGMKSGCVGCIEVNEAFFHAFPPSLESLTFKSVYPTFGPNPKWSVLRPGRPHPPFFGAGNGGRGRGGVGFFQNFNAPATLAPINQLSELDITWEHTRHWMSILPSTIRHLALIDTDLDLNHLPISIETFKFHLKRYDRIKDDIEFLVPPHIKFPPSLRQLDIPALIMPLESSHTLPSSIKIVKCSVSENWTQHDVKRILESCPSISFHVSNPINFIWNNREIAASANHIPKERLNSLNVSFSIPKLIFTWFGPELYSRCGTINWKPLGALESSSIGVGATMPHQQVLPSEGSPTANLSSNSGFSLSTTSFDDFTADTLSSIAHAATKQRTTHEANSPPKNLSVPSKSDEESSSSNIEKSMRCGTCSRSYRHVHRSTDTSLEKTPPHVVSPHLLPSSVSPSPPLPLPPRHDTGASLVAEDDDPSFASSMSAKLGLPQAFLQDSPTQMNIKTDLPFALPISTQVLDLRRNADGSEFVISDAQIEKQLEGLSHLEVFMATRPNEKEIFGNRPLFSAHTTLAALSNLTTLHLLGWSLNFPLAYLPRSLTSLVSQASNIYPVVRDALANQPLNVRDLPRGLIRLEAPSLLIPPQTVSNWPQTLTSLIFYPEDWRDVDVEELKNFVPSLKKLHLDHRIFYTGELSVVNSSPNLSSLCSVRSECAMDEDKPTIISKTLTMRDDNIFRLYDIHSTLLAHLAPATFRKVEFCASGDVLWSTEIESIELMRTPHFFSLSLHDTSDQHYFALSGVVGYLESLLLPMNQLKPPTTRHHNSPLISCHIQLNAASLLKYPYLTSLKLGIALTTLADIATLPKTLRHLSVILDPAEYRHPHLFRQFPSGLESLVIKVTETIEFEEESLAEVPSNLTDLDFEFMYFSPLFIEEWAALARFKRLSFNAHLLWKDTDVRRLGQMMCDGLFENLTVRNCLITGALVPGDTAELSVSSMMEVTDHVLGSRYSCQWKKMGGPLVLPQVLQKLDLYDVLISVIPRYIKFYPPHLKSLTLHVRTAMQNPDFSSLPSSLTELRIFSTARVELKSPFWASLPPNLEILQVENIKSATNSSAFHTTFPFSSTLYESPVLHGFDSNEAEDTLSTFGMSLGATEDLFASCSVIPYIPQLGTKKLQTLIIPHCILGEACLVAFNRTLRKLHVYQLENVQNLSLYFAHPIDYRQTAKRSACSELIKRTKDAPSTRNESAAIGREEQADERKWLAPTGSGGYFAGSMVYVDAIGVQPSSTTVTILDSSNILVKEKKFLNNRLG